MSKLTKEKPMKNTKARHGDVSFHAAGKLPKGAKKVKTAKEHVVQYGEVTGHKHVLRSEQPFDVFEHEGRLLYLLNAPAVVTHEDHLTFVNPMGTGLYEQKQEIEEDPWSGMLRKVVD